MVKIGLCPPNRRPAGKVLYIDEELGLSADVRDRDSGSDDFRRRWCNLPDVAAAPIGSSITKANPLEPRGS